MNDQWRREIFDRYLESRSDVEADGELMPFDWAPFPETIESSEWAYARYLDSHSRELSNEINQFRRYLKNLRSWACVMEGNDERQTLEIVTEFVYPIAALCLSYPYAIRSRFIFSAAHLCHQANRKVVEGWVDKFPANEEVDFGVLDTIGAKWRSFKPFKKRLERIANSAYRKETSDYRNKFNHRYLPNLEIGLTEDVTRYPNRNGRVSYRFGGGHPLRLEVILPALVQQHECCSLAYGCYQELVSEQVEHIFT